MHQAAHALTTTTAPRPLVSLAAGQPVVDSQDVARQFGRPHKSVLASIDIMLARRPDLLGQKFLPEFAPVATGNGGVREVRSYLLNRDGFSLLVMGFTGERALQWKLDYIEAFNAMEAELRSRQAPAAFDPNDPASLRHLLIGYSEALISARAEVVETRQALVVAETVIEDAKPKIEAYEAFLDDAGLCNLRTAARAVDAPNDLFLDWIKDRRYVIRENGDLQPAAAMRRDGYMKLRLTPDNVGKLRGQAMVTRAGLEWLRQRWAVGPGKVLALQAALADR